MRVTEHKTKGRPNGPHPRPCLPPAAGGWGSARRIAIVFGLLLPLCAALTTPNAAEKETPSALKSIRDRTADLRAVLSTREAPAGANAPPPNVANEMVDMRLRVAWGGGVTRAWQGVLRLSEGTFSEVVNLGREADDPGSLDVGESEVQVVQPSPSGFAGFDVTIRGPRQAELVLELAPRDQPTELRTLRAKLSDLLARPQIAELDEQRNRCHISRAPGDRLRVKLAHEHLVFAPRDEVTCEVEPHFVGIEPGTSLRCRVALIAARDDDELWKHDTDCRIAEDGRLPPIGPLSIPLPDNEGVYEIRVSLFSRRITDSLSLSRAKPLLQRSVQLVSVSPTPPALDPTPWRTLAEIDPAHTRLADEANSKWTDWLKRIPTLKLGNGFSQGPLSNNKAGHREHDGRTLTSLEPQGWIAYPLPVGRTDEPHVLEIEYPSNIAQTLGISIVEPNAAGRVTPLGLDSGIDVTAREPGTTTQWLRHRLVFWPHTKTPLVLLTNRRDDMAAVMGKISVQTGPARLTSPLAVGVDAPPLRIDERMIAAFFDRPMFPENFGAGEALDSDGDGTWDDWQTFYWGGRRLVEYLKYAGYNSAVVSIACEGSGLYPSRLLEPTPKYDSGIFFGSAQDPLRKDVAELLFRLFDREGLKLIPAVQFAAPLPELEKARRRGAISSGWQWVGADGQTWLQQYQSNRGLAPHYNVLHGDVQNAMLAVVGEIVERYGGHASFGGLALQLGPDGFAQLPGSAWGFDDETIERFAREASVEVPGSGATRYSARAKFLLGEGRARWHAWRAEALTDFYGRVAAMVGQGRAGAPLILATADVLTSAAAQQQLRPTLPRRPDVGDFLLSVGIDSRRLAEKPGVVLLRAQRIAPLLSLAGQGVNLEWNRSAEVDRLFTPQGTGGAQWYHESLPLEVPSFDSVSPFGAEQTHVWLAAHIASSGIANRQRLIHSVAVSDAAVVLDGGWLLTLGEEEAVRAIWSVYRQLPARGFQTVTPRADSTGQPLVVRRCDVAEGTVVYVVNDSPWAAAAEVDLQAAVVGRARSLGLSEAPTLEKRDTTTCWRVRLEPYDIRAIEISAPRVNVADWRAVVDPEAARILARRVNETRIRLNEMRTPKSITTLANPGFETSSRDAVVQWLHARGAGISVTVDGKESHGGDHSLRLRSTKDVAWVRSEPIATPTTGRLAVWAWLKVRDASKQPTLRLAIEGRLDGRTYYRFANVGAGKMAPLQEQWTQYWFQIDDLPTQGLTDLRVGFDLMGAGEVWVDDVQLFDLWFYDNERDELAKQIAQADFQLKNGRIADCDRFLQGYWPRFLQRHVTVEPRAATVGGANAVGGAPSGSTPRGAALTEPAERTARLPTRSDAKSGEFATPLAPARTPESNAAAAGGKTGEKTTDAAADKNGDKGSDKSSWRERMNGLWSKKSR